MSGEGEFCISIPVRNGVEWLPLALDSIAAQTVPARIALLDASGDGRVADLAARHRERIAYAYHRQSDDGQAAAIAEGWRHVPGEFLAWLNADDQLLPGALERARAAFAADLHLDVVYGHAAYLAADGTFQTYFPAISADAWELRHANVICQPACFFRRAAVARVGGLNPDLHYTMDWDLWLRLLDADCRFLFVNEPLAAVRNYPATKTNSGDVRRHEEIRAILGRHSPGRVRRAATLMGIALGDLHTRGDVASSRVLDSAISLGRHVGRWLRRSGRQASETRVLGLERAGNRVENSCRIVIPNDFRGPGRLCLFTARPGRFSVRWGEEWLELRAAGRGLVPAFGGQRPAYAYTSAELAQCPALIDVELRGQDGPWRLLGVRIVGLA